MDGDGGFGPHEQEILRVLDEAARLPAERVPELLAFASDDREADVARREVTRLRRDREFGPRLDRAEEAARRWAMDVREDRLVRAGGYEGSGPDAATRAVAGRVLFDALAALIARNRLAPGGFDALFGPWHAVVRGIPREAR